MGARNYRNMSDGGNAAQTNMEVLTIQLVKDQVWVQSWHNVYKVNSTGNTVDHVLKTMEVRFLH